MTKRPGLILASILILAVLVGLGVIMALTLHAFGCALLLGLPDECR